MATWSPAPHRPSEPNPPTHWTPSSPCGPPSVSWPWIGKFSTHGKCGYVLTRGEDFPSDLKLLRRRYADLCDAPPLYDCMRFPDRSLVNDMLAFNRAYRQHLDNRQSMELSNAWELHEMLLEADRLYQIWDLVRDTRCDYYYVTVRRQALKKLKEMIGDQAYYSGSLPPHVPVWQFARIDY